jgi:hypothetical protein
MNIQELIIDTDSRNATLISLRTHQNFSQYQSLFITTEEGWGCPDYENMSLEDMLVEDTKPMFITSSMDDIKDNRRKNELMNQFLDAEDRVGKGLFHMNKQYNKNQECYENNDKLYQEYAKHRDEFKALMARYEFQKNRFESLSPAQQRIKSADWKQWSAVLWDKANIVKANRNIAWATFEEGKACFQEGKAIMKKYQSSYKAIKEYKDTLANHITKNKYWGDYYSTKNDDIGNPYCIDNDTGEEVDNQEFYHDRNIDIDCIRDTHYLEMSKEDIVWNDRSFDIQLSVKIMDDAQKEEILAAAPF